MHHAVICARGLHLTTANCVFNTTVNATRNITERLTADPAGRIRHLPHGIPAYDMRFVVTILPDPLQSCGGGVDPGRVVADLPSIGDARAIFPPSKSVRAHTRMRFDTI